MQESFRRAIGRIMLLIIFTGAILESFQSVNAGVVICNRRLNTVGVSANIAHQYQNVTHEGDLFISGNETFTIQDSEFKMNGTITANDSSTLIIRDSNFTTITSSSDHRSIVLMDQASLILVNATVIFENPEGFECYIMIYDHAKANITSTMLQNRGIVVGYDYAAIYVDNSTIIRSASMRLAPEESSGVATFDSSTAKIGNSTLDGVYVWGNSTALISDSVAGIIRTGSLSDSEGTSVNITNSVVNEIETWDYGLKALHVKDSEISYARLSCGSSAWFISCSVTQMSADDDASIWLVDSSYREIETHDNATVLVGWHLPLFGLVTMPYIWIPILQLFSVGAVVATITIVLLILFRKVARHGQKEKFLGN